ncbi:uncharacterized protein LOC129770199 [Toxorhynchites rutilus septentrionalis]|uniref:uncharacterized protein LOC129770199 n=1 Tax=Toxorhynchites rutilus septentrionalis TaxID=329112 RepID=UPI0024785A83|nr:uncharacterized protein LOC129770199 [Toxorhynchites rutilus septentrionalis]
MEIAEKNENARVEVTIVNHHKMTDEVNNLESNDDEKYDSANNSLNISSPSTITLPSQNTSQQLIRHSERERRFPGEYLDYDLTCSVIPQDISFCQESMSCTDGGEPKSFEEANDSRDKEKWYSAMMDEIEALKSNDTWELADLPPRRTPLKNKRLRLHRNLCTCSQICEGSLFVSNVSSVEFTSISTRCNNSISSG